MAKFSKILPRILLTICVLILVSSMLLSAIFAKYVTSNNTTSKIGRPAAFEVLMEKEFDDLMHVSFAEDGEPGNPLGHTRVTKDYKFSVVSNYTEVALTYDLIIEFNSVVGKMMYTGKTNPFADGISCYYEVYEVTDEGETKLSGTEILSGTAVTKWTYTKPYLAPNPDTQRKNNYILRVTFYNNTDMTVNSNGYTFSSDAVTITANARQVNVNGSLSASIINGTQTAWNMSDGIDRTLKISALPQNTQLDLRIPITEAGTYDISFDAGLELTKQGASATLSVPKTVYKYGDEIPISYDIFDASNITDDTAWIAIASTVYHEERYVKWGYVGGDIGKVTAAISGTVNYTILSGAPQEHASSFKDGSGRLLPGSYRIYLLQGNTGSGIYNTTDDKFLSQYILTDPINITILPPDNLDDESVNGNNTVENNIAMLSTSQAIYRYGDEIEISYKIKGLHGVESYSWISMASPVDWTYSRWAYVNDDNLEHTIDFKTTYEDPGDGSYFESCYDSNGDLLPGYYRIVLVKDGAGLESSALLGADTSSPASLSILVLPESQSSGISTYETTPYGSASMTLNSTTNIFYAGSPMEISVATNGALTGYTAGGPWVARGRLDMNTGYYVYPSATDVTSLSNGTHTFGGLNTPGNYLLCFCGAAASSQTAMNYKPYYVPAIGVTVVKNYNLIPNIKTDSETVSGSAVNNLYSGMQSGSVSFTATQKDVENGYVTLSFDFSDFDASTYYNININNFSITKNT